MSRFKTLLDRLPESLRPVPLMTDANKRIILKFAQGDASLRDAAVGVFYDHYQTVGPQGSPEMRFMSEVLQEFPDITLKSRYRQELLASAPAVRAAPRMGIG